ncbi:DinB family protein [Robertkochia aurantiaca]|uniref:DinB family protein n=1 Tax=Robertkochia aurantiaca TaxID=2873700 RepID=UPI001CCF0746|nr:DinB family protein [Robertkochia sp. 3YJGBD-33]
MIKQTTIAKLEQLIGLLETIKAEDFKQRHEVLSNASIGMHLRHVIEFYQCLIKGIGNGSVNYDSRSREPELELNPALCRDRIRQLIGELKATDFSGPLMLSMNLSNGDDNTETVSTTFNRELLYNLEHLVHHEALIRIGIREMTNGFTLPEEFGVAVSTIRNRNSCAQ